MTRRTIFNIGFFCIIIIFVIFYFIQEEKRLDAILDKQNHQIEANSAEFNQVLEKIQEDLENGKITNEEARRRRLKAYEKTLQSDQKHFQRGIDEIVGN